MNENEETKKEPVISQREADIMDLLKQHGSLDTYEIGAKLNISFGTAYATCRMAVAKGLITTFKTDYNKTRFSL